MERGERERGREGERERGREGERERGREGERDQNPLFSTSPSGVIDNHVSAVDGHLR